MFLGMLVEGAVAALKWIALYVRISRDREGRAEGVDRQVENGTRYCEAHWPGVPIKVYSDNDLTAADPGTYRPEYARLLSDVRAGHVLQVVSADQDRLTRQPSEWEDLVVVLGSAGITETHGYRDGITPVAGSKLVGRVKAAVAAEYVEGIKTKVNEKLKGLADEGRPSGARSYGYEHVIDDEGRKALAVIPEQATAARWMASAVLSGWRLSAIVEELEARGIPTRLGGRWQTWTVRQLLTSPTIAGLRVHQGDVLRKGNWEPILDEATWRQVCAVLTGPRIVERNGEPYVVRGQTRARRKYLLTGGPARCGKCGHHLSAQSKAGRTPESPRISWYFCPSKKRGGCGGVGVGADPLEAHVRDELIAWLKTPEFAAALAADNSAGERDRLTGRLAEIQARRTRLATRWARGELGDDEWDAARAELTADHDRCTAALAAVPPPTFERVDADELAADWEYMTLNERAALVARHIESVIVAPVGKGARGFRSERVTIRFAGQAG